MAAAAPLTKKASLVLTVALIATALVQVANGATHSADVDPALLGTVGKTLHVIVQKVAGADASVEHAVVRAGGTVTRDLSIVHGFAATIPSAAVDDIARLQAVRAISLDRVVRVMDLPQAPPAPPAPPTTTTTTSPTPDATVSVDERVDRATNLWSAGYTGTGVTVAVIDTGISTAQPDLQGRIVKVANDTTGALEDCVNFSGEAGCQDSYGHGTFVAGVIAGNGSSSNGKYKGIAPNANVLAVKLSGRNGAADVSALLAAIQWVVEHKEQYGIRVLNLSIGSDSPQSYRIDPLNYAVEQAWDAGIVVCVAASNAGPNPATITKPADDPFVITVGAIDDHATVDLGDDLMPDFSGRGPTLADGLPKPDLVAPGAHMISLRSPGSAIDENFPYFIDSWYRKGSGTSFSTPAVAGAVALMIQRDPTLVPNRVKYALMSTARPTASSNQFDVGAGLLDAYAAATNAPAGMANQNLVFSTGLGSLDLSRGTLLMDMSGADGALVPIAGAMTQAGLPFDQAAYTGASWHGASWHSSQWAGASWHGASWHGASWHGASWHGASWHGASWHSADGNDSQANYGTGYLGSILLGAWE